MVPPGAPIRVFASNVQKIAKKMNFEQLRVAQSLKKCILIDKNGFPGRKQHKSRLHLTNFDHLGVTFDILVAPQSFFSMIRGITVV